MNVFRYRKVVLASLASLILVAATWMGSTVFARPDPVQEAWERSQKIGAYRFSTDILQTTILLPAVANTGHSPRQESYHLEGDVNRAGRQIYLLLTKNNNNIQNTNDNIEIEFDGGTARARAGSSEWQVIENPEELFAGSFDPLAYLLAARDLQDLGTETHWLPGGARRNISRYSFALDGPALARHIRDQLEDYYRSIGQLPGGVRLEIPSVYRDA
ncbi:MAG: hypothetical protein JXA42_19815, partial [Anaerolineales bacterium]|nr:hypothetical protein [Anaerolineales bacterium]